MSSSESFQHHSDFYFDDGNICVIAEQTVFKIFKGLLAKQSSVFADMLALPTLPDLKEYDKYEGVPCVRLSDSSKDVTVLFEYLWSPPCVPISFFSPSSPHH